MEQTEHATLCGPEFAPLSGGKAKSLAVMLHGYGADGNDLISLAPIMAQKLPDTHFIAPHAPNPCEMAPFGHQWFSLRDWSPKAMLRGATEAFPVLSLFISLELKRLGLEENRLALIGFSQGTMMALYTGLRRAKPCAAIAGFSGALVGEEGITVKPPVCLVHGDQDNVVPHGAMVLAEAALKHNGILVEAHTRHGLGHGIDPEGLDIVTDFLAARLK